MMIYYLYLIDLVGDILEINDEGNIITIKQMINVIIFNIKK